MLDYIRDSQIDENALDIECLEQPALAMRYGKHYLALKKQALLAAERVKVVTAELIKKANSNPLKYCKKDKPNAADIEAFYRTRPEHKEAKEAWINAQYEADMAEHAKNEICFTRKASLENLITLHGQQYFAGPKTPRNISFEASKKRQQQKTDSGVASKLNRTKK
jgi:hypothetical protein